MKKREKRSIIWQSSNTDFIALVKKSKTFSEMLKYFGLNYKNGNNFRTLKDRIKELDIDISHIKLGLGNNKGRKFNYTHIPYNKLFTINSNTCRHSIKKRILNDNLIPYKCSICGLDNTWNNQKLVLVLDHINGISNDHRLENLRFLCPNCNSQQSTFAGHNKHKVIKKEYKCIKCNSIITGLGSLSLCYKCANENRFPPLLERK
ncbi:MAG: hypothetical protein WC783_04175, partial [Candidatus Paceibacterota bacterium]